ncbi:MAG: dTMP kinase [Dehalococcoidia bacterium]|nr:dTMP kinase [Dehalococcoidia bacterium]
MKLFITFEGGEGCGKSTQARILWRKLHQENVPAILTHEPGGTALGNEIRRLLKRRQGSHISPQAELFLFAACRGQLLAEVIHPALAEGRVVVCDRFAHSTLAYQGYGRGLDSTVIDTINNLATQNLKPDLTILLDTPPEQALARKLSLKDRFELEDLSFHRRVREGYLKTAATDPNHWLVIDASLPKRKISEIIWDQVSQLLPCPPSLRTESPLP